MNILKAIFIGLILLLCAKSVQASPAEPVVQSEETKTEKKPNDKPKAQVVQVEESPVDQDAAHQGKPNRDDKKVERFVMPFTRWIEGKLQDSSVVNPTSNKVKKVQSQQNQLTLRTAIKQALSQYPGTVLSADKSKLDSGLEFRVKILSKDGVIRMITIQSDEQGETRKD